MTSIREYAKKTQGAKSIRDYAATARDLDLGKIQDKRMEEIRLMERPPEVKRSESIASQIKMLEDRGMYKQAYDLRKMEDDYLRKQAGVDKQSEGIVGWFNPLFQGIGDVSSGLGSAINYADKALGTRAFSGTAQKMKDFGQKTQENFRDLEYEQRIGEFDWGDLKDPEFYHHTMLRALPFSVSLLPASMALTYAGGAVGAGAATTGAGAMGIGEFGTTVLNAIGRAAGTIAGSTLARSIESATEAGQTYDEMLAKTGDEEMAKKAGNKVFANNMKLGGMDAAEILLAFTPTKKIPFLKSSKLFKKGIGKAVGYGLKALGTGAMEGTEELLQKKFQDEAMGREFSLKDPATREAGVTGALMGIGMGGFGDVFTGFQEKIADKMSEKAKADYKKEVEKELAKGTDEKVARLLAMDKATKKNKGVITAVAANEIKEITEQEKIKEKAKGKIETSAEEVLPEEKAPEPEQKVEEKPKKKIKVSEKDLNDADAIDRFLLKHHDNLSKEQVDNLLKLQDLVYAQDEENKYAREQKRMQFKNKIFYNNEEYENQYKTFKNLLRGAKKETVEKLDYARFVDRAKNKTKADNALYTQEMKGDELLDIFKERLLEERYGKTEKGSGGSFSSSAEITELQNNIIEELTGKKVEPEKEINVDEIDFGGEDKKIKETPLHKEAKKYDSFDEFTEAQRVKYIQDKINSGLSILEKDTLKQYPKKIAEFKNDLLNLENNIKRGVSKSKKGEIEKVYNLIKNQLDKYKLELQGVRDKKNKLEKDIFIDSFFNETPHKIPEIYRGGFEKFKKNTQIKTKSQLKQIWEEAHKKDEPKAKKETPKVSEKTKPQKAHSETKKEKTTSSTKKTKTNEEILTEQPVKVKGEKKLSRYAQRISEALQIENADNPEYNAVKGKEDAARALNYVNENWDDAVEIARNYKLNNTNIRTTAIRIAVREISKETDPKLSTEIFNKLSRALTRHGQEMEAAKYQYHPNNSDAYAQEIIKIRRMKAGEFSIFEDAKGVLRAKNSKTKIETKKAALKEKIDSEVKDTTKVQDIINSIIC